MFNKAAKKSNQPSHFKDLALLFAIPIGIALLAAIIIYTPRLLANPKNDFIYSVCSDYDCSYNFNVNRTGRISQYNLDTSYYGSEPILKYYNAKDGSTRSLTSEDAKRYHLNSSSKSSDGYSLVREESGGDFLFGGNYKSNWYLKNGAKKKKVELFTGDSYGSSDIKFLGWIEE